MQWRLTKLRGEYCLTWDDGTIKGKRRRYRLGTTDRGEAARRAPAIFAELTRPASTRIEDLWNGYVRDLDGRAVTQTMRFTWRALQNRFGGLDADRVTIADCRAHTEERRGSRIGDGTIHTELGHLRMVLLWAQKHRLIEHAPPIERPAKPEPKDAYLTRDEVRDMIAAAHTPHIKLAIMLLIGTGARNEAAMQLTWDRVDFERRMIQLRNPFDKSFRKGRATVPINDTLLAALETAKEARGTPFVIEWADEPVKSIKRGLKAAGRAINRPDVSPHMLRHSAAVWLAEGGHDMEEISQFMGHNNTKITTKVYARFSPTHLRRLADDLET